MLFPTIAAEPGRSERDLAAAFSIGVLLYAPSTLAAGLVIDRACTRWPMLVGSLLAVMSLGLIATATPTNSWQLHVGWAAASGPGAAFIGYTPTVKLLSMAPVESLGRAMGLAMVGQGVSPLVIGPAMQALSDPRDWQFAVASFAAVVLVLLPPLNLATVPAPPSHATSNAARFSLAASNEGAHPHAFWLFLVGFFALGTCS